MSSNDNNTLNVGDKAPDFTLPLAGGESDKVSLSDYAGRYLVLYFYPRDNTPGCTIEGKEFSAVKSEFQALGASILGVSKDSIKKHENFIAKQELTIPLAFDDSEMIESYGAWVEKKNYGKTYMGIQRATFLIGPDGRFQEIWPKVRVKGHVDAVYEALKTIIG